METLSVLSFNIRCENDIDGLNGWEYRKSQAIDLLKSLDADLIGLQEVTQHQANDLIDSLVGYHGVNIGRDDGIKGEATSIFIKASRFDIMNQGYFWCSSTPDKTGSIGWDAVFPRTIVYVILKDKVSQKEICFFNTHLDHVGKIARRESSRMLIKKAEEIAHDLPILVVGDFNAKPDAKAIRLFFENGYREASKEIKRKKGQPKVSFHAFNYDPQRKEDSTMEWIDYIFTKGFTTLDFDVITSSMDGKYPSDHFPIIAKVNYDL